jgi:acid phosphatase
LRQLLSEYGKRAAERWDGHLSKVSAAVSEEIPTGIAIQATSPVASGILDTINASIGNNIPLPNKLMDIDLRRSIESAVVSEWFDGYIENVECKKLGAGPILSDMLRRFELAVEGGSASKEKLAIYSAHDTSLGSLLASLDCFDNRWPKFTSFVMIELLQRENHGGVSKSVSLNEENGDWYVQLRYNGKPLSIPGLFFVNLC